MGAIVALIPLLSPFSLIAGVVGVVFGSLACVSARRGLSSKPISGAGLALSLLAVGLSIWGLTSLVHATQKLAGDLSALGSLSVSAPVATPSVRSETPSAPSSSQTSSSPRTSSATPTSSTTSPTYTPAGTYDVAANTGSTLDYQALRAQGRASIKDWIRESKPASPVIAPGAGKRWVAFRITLENTGTTRLGFNSLGFILVDKDGYRYPTGTAFGNITAGPLLSSGELSPGESTTGYVVTEVPKGASLVELKMDRVYGNASWALK